MRPVAYSAQSFDLNSAEGVDNVMGSSVVSCVISHARDRLFAALIVCNGESASVKRDNNHRFSRGEKPS
jgi:hypothetical protein